MTSGTIVRWSRKEGERTVKGEELALFESEDATYEIAAPSSGVLLRIVQPIGSSVAVGQVVALIGEVGEAAPPSHAVGSAQGSAQGQGAAPPEPRLETQMGLKVKEVVPLSETRRTIGKRLNSSLQSTAQVTLVYEADASELVRLREAILPEIEARTGVRVTYTDLLVKAVARALRENPVMNSTLEDDGIKLIDEVNIGVAVATERGLIVPVLRNADALDLVGVVTSMKEMASRGREGKLKLKEVTSGTFTITNLGMTAVDSFTPILNPPQVGILGVGRIVKKPVVVEGDRVEVRSRVTLSLTFDHRVVDGFTAAEFLRKLVEIIEDRGRLAETAS
jgi:pyruvate dehydrogenase E2 component (dihydrolipoamide acetyltransferase)